MSSAQAIGTGAVVLTATADQLSAGLDKARADDYRWAQQTEAATSKAGVAPPALVAFPADGAVVCSAYSY
jgi:hypothetical protein